MLSELWWAQPTLHVDSYFCFFFRFDRRDARARIAFYASTPSYRAAFDHLGLGQLADECKVLSRAQRWEELPAKISDDVLDQFAVIGTYDEIGDRLCARFGEVVTNIEFSIAINDVPERTRLAGLARQIQAHDSSAVHAMIAGTRM